MIVSIVCLLMVSCKKDVVPVPPEIKINNIVAQLTSVSIKGEYIFEGEIKNIYIIYGKDSLMVDTETRKMNIVEKNISVDIEGLTMDTRYYYQIQCVNKYSRYTCEIASFTTLGLRLATVTTNDVTDITTNSASCGGDVTFDGNSTVTSRGVCWGTKPNPTTSDKITVNGKGKGTFISRLSNLTAETTYYVRAYAINEKGTAYGEERSFKTLAIALPTVTTNDVTDITINSASCGGNVTDGGGATVTERGICWSTNPNPTINDHYKTTGVEIGIGDFTLQLSNLTSQTTYYVRAYATNKKGTAYGEEKSFKTLEIGIPMVTTSEVVNIKVNSASCGGNVRSDGGKAVTARGVCWSTKPNPTINDEKTTNGSGTGYFPSNLTNLTGNTTYYVRAYATNEKGTAYGEEKSFTTFGEATLPTVTTNNVTNITATSASCGGNVTSDGGFEVTSRGVCWSTSPNPTIDNKKTYDGKGAGTFTSQLSNLAPETTYYVRAYATNIKGTSYGEEMSFTTLKITVPTVTTRDVTDITLNSATCGGNVTYSGGREVTARGVCWSTNPNPTINDNKTTDGSGTGSFTSNLTNLTAYTTYYVRAYATNEKGTSYGDEKSFTTEEEEEEEEGCEPDGEINGYGYVDLGLPSGVKWATCNVGASSPEEYGDYFAWGETTTKTEYSSSSTSGLSISELQSQGYIDGNNNLTPQHDAATANWGGNWRMPTKDEMQELLDNCEWIWTAWSGVDGYKVIGSNGNCIFLPAAGYRVGLLLHEVGSNGGYWSSIPYTDNYDASILGFYANDRQDMFISPRNNGQTIRPVSGNYDYEPIIQLPTVTTNNITNITSSSATCGGNVTSDGNATITACGICWSEYPNPTIYDNIITYADSISFTSNLINLTANTTYYVRAYATNEAGTSYGEEKSFTTLVEISQPTVTTNNVTNITSSSAICGGNVTSDGNTTVTSRGICWSEYPNPTINDNKTTDGSGKGSFTSNLINLTENTTYYVRAYATNGKGTSYGEEKSFKTLEITLPTVATNNITNIKANSATCGGNVTSDGNATVTSLGVCWSTSSNPTIDDNKTTDGSGTGSFTSNLINLTENTTYYVRAYATNEKGTSYGEERSFTTKRIVEIELDAEGNEIITLNGVVFKMIKVEGGTFQMGAQRTNPDGANYDSDAYGEESPVHSVTLSDYYIGETEVTQELWEAVMGSNPSNFKGSQKPVEEVSWNKCQGFITRLNNLTGKNFRLPTEAEWEYAARGGNKSQGYKYSGSDNIEDVAWYTSNSSSTTHNVKTKSPNELGIYDMSGNVWEWCEDWYGDYSSGSHTNPTGPSSGSLRVLRGGSWNINDAEYCRVSRRNFSYPGSNGSNCFGFRLALSQ